MLNSNKNCIVSFAKGGSYPKAMARLKTSLIDVGSNAVTHFYTDESQVGAPTHREAPYAFKVLAIEKALGEGYRNVLWVDSSVWAVKPLGSLWKHIDHYGNIFFDCGYQTSQWSSDASLKSFGITRDKAEDIRMLMACCFGLSNSAESTTKWVAAMKEKAFDGVTFKGSWKNDNNEVSSDPRCSGHRHDQTAASIICYNLKINLIDGKSTFFTYDSPNPPENVCLLAQGIE